MAFTIHSQRGSITKDVGTAVSFTPLDLLERIKSSSVPTHVKYFRIIVSKIKFVLNSLQRTGNIKTTVRTDRHQLIKFSPMRAMYTLDVA